MAKYSLGENNPIENIFSDKPSEVSSFSSVGDRLNQNNGTFDRCKLTKVFHDLLSSAHN